VADDDEILLVSQVAADFAVTEQTVRAWLHSGKLKGRRVGKAYRILRSDVLAMLEAARLASAAAHRPVGARRARTRGSRRESSLRPEAGLVERRHALAAADTRGE